MFAYKSCYFTCGSRDRDKDGEVKSLKSQGGPHVLDLTLDARGFLVVILQASYVSYICSLPASDRQVSLAKHAVREPLVPRVAGA